MAPRDTRRDLSDSERAALEELRRDHERDRIIKEHEAAKSASRIERIKAWAVFISVIAGIKGLLWEPLIAAFDLLRSHLK